MTEIEAAQFVADEIQGRTPKLSDAQRSDWLAVVKPIDLSTARRIVRELATDPDETYLTARAFAKRVRQAQAAAGEGQPRGTARLVYGDDGEFEVFIVDTNDPARRTRFSYPTARVYECGVVLRIPWDSDRLMEALQGALKAWHENHPGMWLLEIKAREQNRGTLRQRPQEGRATSLAGMAAVVADRLPRPAPAAPQPRLISDYRGKSSKTQDEFTKGA